MRLRANCTITEISGEKVIIIQGKDGVNLTKVIMFNPTSELLWRSFDGVDFSIEDIENHLVQEFGISREVATSDVADWLDSLNKAGLLVGFE
ncbi:hypothetical protein SDC9_133418 [bioreactor metagenome]|uniref:Coenzyme PQQ synthesis protein D n=1 Tax=bioreactor metagenome TaxID=1076179 RepID=A0A645DAV4_9ZZZZ